MDGARVEVVGPNTLPEAVFQVFIAMFIGNLLTGGRLPEVLPALRSQHTASLVGIGDDHLLSASYFTDGGKWHAIDARGNAGILVGGNRSS